MDDYRDLSVAELLKRTKIPIEILDTDDDVYYDMARVMLEEIRKNNAAGKNTVMIVPVGPVFQYRRFARLANMERLDCSRVYLFNMDEYLTDDKQWLPENHPLSFHGFMRRELYDKLEGPSVIPEKNRFFPEPGKEGEIWERIQDLGGVDVALGGIGIRGHIAFNEALDETEEMPNEEFCQLSTRILPLTKETRTINSVTGLGGYIDGIPRWCITIGMKEILSARKIRFYLNREWQKGLSGSYAWTLFPVMRQPPSSKSIRMRNWVLPVTQSSLPAALFADCIPEKQTGSNGGGVTLIIDFHHHLLLEDSYGDRLVTEMGRLGIQYTCLIGLGIGHGKQDHTDYGKFSKDAGFLGLKVTRPRRDYDDDAYMPLYEEAERQNMPILFHTGMILTTRFDKEDDVSSNRMRPMMLDRVARRYPDLKIVIAHMGYPWFDEAATIIRYHANVFVDFTASAYGWRNRLSPADFQKLMFWEGAFRKVVFGTDVGIGEIEGSLNDQKQLFQLLNLSQETQDLIFYKNAKYLLGI